MTRPVGRPTDYKKEYCEVAVNFLKQGKGKIQLASHLNIAKSVLDNWEKSNPEFQSAIELGMTHSEARWMDKGEENICNKDFSVRNYELQMANRFKWARNIKQEQDNKQYVFVTEQKQSIERCQEERKKFEKDI